MTGARVAGVVLAAGRSRRLGTPKQLLPYGATTLLGATLEVARRCRFDQLIVTLGGASGEVSAAVALDGVQTVVAKDFAAGCSSSLRAALAHVDPMADGIVLMLGDQPGVRPACVARLLALRGANPIAVCRYSNGIGHPFWLGRPVFADLDRLHGDKGVWKLVDRARASGTLAEVPIDDAIPLDVDTWADYRRLLESVPR
ncbi:MAG: molybdenum cofactor cytidylyltransferase [Pseudonocardiales bacterium]|nr:molybdenum cofactor cytidylyltransferase [Pseudonocardiales bacterium]